MSLNEQDIAQLASRRLKGAPVLPLMSFVQNALNNLTRQVAADQFRRKLLVTDQTTTTASITTSTPYCYADTTTLQTTPGIALDWIRQGSVFFAPSVTANPYVLSGGEYASGYWTFNANPQNDETIAVNGVTFTFKKPSAIVADGATLTSNGTYTYNGQVGGKSSYILGAGDGYIRFIEDTWYILDDSFVNVYIAQSSADEPWDVPYGLWETGAGATPGTIPTTTKQTSFTSVQVEIEANLSATITNFITTLNASANASITVATYAVGLERGTVIGTYDTQGTGGNSFTLANSSLASVVRSGATFTGGASTAYALAIVAFTTYFDDLSRVQFTTTGSLPTGISASTNYYLTDYTIDGETATFGLSSTADGLTPVTISTAGSGVLTMVSMNKEVCQWLESPNQGMLTPAIPIDYIYIWLEKDLLYTSTTAGTFSFAVPFIPKNVESLPSQLTNDLVDEVVQIALTAGFEEITPAEK